MSNYRRLISYIYAYEGGIKGKNIGFAKIESRGIQCRITVNVKKIYVGSNEIGVYLLSGEKEILLGNIFIRGGCGEFRSLVSFDDVEHSGSSMDQCHGLTVHDVNSAWRAYTTIWEDAVAHAAEVDLEDAISNEKKESGISDAQIRKAMREIEAEFPLKTVMAAEYSRELMPDAEVRAETLKGIDVSIAPYFKMAQPRQQLSKQQDEWGRAVLAMENTEAVKSGSMCASADMDAAAADRGISDIACNGINCVSNGMANPEMTNPEMANPEMTNPGIAAPDMANTSVDVSENLSPEIPYSNISGSGLVCPAMTNPEIPQPVAPEHDPAMPGRELPVRDPEIPGRELPVRDPEIPGRELPIRDPSMPGRELPVRDPSMPGRETPVRDPALPGREMPDRDPESQQQRRFAAGQKPQHQSQFAGGQKPQHQSQFAGEQKPQHPSQFAAEPEPQQRQFATAPNQPGNMINAGDMEEPTQEQIWSLLKKTHTKILPFDYEHGCETLTIKPQDIGLLPRESWVYGNNSFLLHGFYNFRYLIISKLENPMGTPYYMLGVPGHFYNNERYMASMFGFPEFVLSKEQPSGEDRFGYWYTFVSLGQ